MKKTGGLIFLILLSSCFFSQNLVPNPSFETFTNCPSASSQLTFAPPWIGTNNSSEYYNGCATGYYNVPYVGPSGGFQPGRTGVAFAGQWFVNGFNGYREYIRAQLTTSLSGGGCYLVKYYVSYPNVGLKFACNNFGAHLSNTAFATGSTNPVGINSHITRFGNPIIKDTLNWVEIAGIYQATGGEQYITLGNFKNDANTDTLRTNYGNYSGAYYYIDDVSVEQVTTPTWQMKDTIITLGDSVLIGPLYSGLTCVWKDLLGNPIGTGSGLYVKPTVNTKYILEQTFCGNTFFDTVEVKIKTDIGINERFQSSKYSRVYPNPSKSEFKIHFAERHQNHQAEISIFDLTGRLILKSTSAITETEITVKNDLVCGTYLLKVKFSDATYDIHRLIITK